jgi:hypothetical protein
MITTLIKLQIRPLRDIRSSKYCVTLWHSLLLREHTSKEGDKKMPHTIYIPDSTWTDLDQEPMFQKFMQEYLDLLQNSLTKIKVKGDSYITIHYKCDQAHDPQNPAWQPFKLLSKICKKYDYDPLIARELIEERIRRRLECECQIIDNQSQNRRKGLINNFGADLGGPGRRDFDIF